MAQQSSVSFPFGLPTDLLFHKYSSVSNWSAWFSVEYNFYYVIHAEGSITFLEIEQNINDWNMGQVEIQTLPSLPETYL